jgi:hypothetical protein
VWLKKKIFAVYSKKIHKKSDFTNNRDMNPHEETAANLAKLFALFFL